MTKNIRIGVGIIASIAVVFAAGAWARTAGVFATPTAIAVVDIRALEDGLDEQNALRDALLAKYRPMQVELAQMQGELQALNIKFEEEGRTMTEEERRDLNIKRLRLDQRIKFTDSILTQSQQLEYYAIMKVYYPKIYDAISEVAERNGWDIVLLDTSTINPSDMDRFQVTDRYAAMDDAVARKHILYVNPNVDITNEVLLLLNNEYADSQVPPPPGTP